MAIGGGGSLQGNGKYIKGNEEALKGNAKDIERPKYQYLYNKIQLFVFNNLFVTRPDITLHYITFYYIFGQ